MVTARTPAWPEQRKAEVLGELMEIGGRGVETRCPRMQDVSVLRDQDSWPPSLLPNARVPCSISQHWK